MRHLARDVRYAWRGLSRSPLFTVVALVSISLGIGANTAIFTLVDQVLLRLLPVQHPEQLVTLWGRGEHYGGDNGPNQPSDPLYAQLPAQKQGFAALFCADATATCVPSQVETDGVC